MLFSLASWCPAEEDLRGWLAVQMTVDHPALGATVPAGTVGGSRAGALLEHRLILPVLDGLDELPEAQWGLAIARISEALYPGEAVVVSSRLPPRTKLPHAPRKGSRPGYAEPPWSNCSPSMRLPAASTS